MFWLAWGCAAVFVGACVWLVPRALFVLGVLLERRARLFHTSRLPIVGLAEGVAGLLLLASGAVAAYAFSYAPPAPRWAQPGEQFEVVVGCASEVRRGMPTVLEQSEANARCYFVTLLASVAPKCESVPEQVSQREKDDAERACRRQLTELWVYGALLFGAGFAAGSASR